MTDFDWGTLCAVARYYELDPNDLERDLAVDRDEDLGNWCAMPISGGYYGAPMRRACSRRAVHLVGTIPVCAQHENVLTGALLRWIDPYWGEEGAASLRDLRLVIEAVSQRLDKVTAPDFKGGDVAASLGIDYAERLRDSLRRFLREDKTTETRAALAELWGA